MRLQLPGEPQFHVLEILLAVMAVVGLCALGCASPRVHSRRVPASVFEAARYEARHEPRAVQPAPRAAQPAPRAAEPAPRADEGAAFVVRTLHAAGLRFGTDGSTRALWGYMRTTQRLVPPAAAKPGDVLFFDTHGTGGQPDCADHAGIVERVTPAGRLGFLELRGGHLRHSFVDPAHPAARRDGRGQILNSFLRPLRTDDPEGARYFAGQMLCGIARAR